MECRASAAGRAHRTPSASAPQTESWTAAGFLGTLGIPELLAAQLVEVGGPNELGALQSLARSPKEELRRRLTSGIDALTDRLSSALENLASGAAPTAEQLQNKFMQDGAGLLAYGDLNTFFGGLEAIVGAPLPRVREAMAAEHTQQPDSHLEFTTENYGITTTSAIEWAFVAESRSHDAWPVEAKLVLARKPGGSTSMRLGEGIAVVGLESTTEAEPPSKKAKLTSVQALGNAVGEEEERLNMRRRAPMPIDELERHVAEQSARLLEQGEPALTLEEAFGARLYTGPLYVKYNAVLRGLSSARLDSPVLYLRCEMVRLCCSAEDAALHAQAAEEANAKRLAEEPSFGERRPTAADEAALHEYTCAAYEAVVQRINKYTTTLHALNSAVIKLSKLTKASTVYRGVHDMVLPDQFWTPNKYGVRGGIDSAFMSTTLKREEAIKYAASGRTAPLIFEIQQGMIDRGADISFLSQYPFEKEILFNPLTGLEVCGSRVEGQLLIVEVKLSINLTSLTIEQVIGKRKKVLQDMVFGLEAEVRQALRTEGLATAYGTEKVLGEFRKDVEEHDLGHPSEWYNGDERLAEALQGMLLARRQYGLGGQRRTKALAVLKMDELKRCGFEPKAYTSMVVEAVTKLEDSDVGVRRAAVKTLGSILMEPATLAMHGAALVARLEDSDAVVRQAVVAMLGKLEPATLAMHGAALVARLEDSDTVVRQAVVAMLGKLEPATIATHGAALVAKLENSDAGVREAVVATLGKLEPATLATHGAALFAMFKDSDAGVRRVVVATLGKLEPATLATHGAALVARLENSDAGVREAVVETLGKLEPATLAMHGAALVAKLEDLGAGVRRVVVATLGKLEPATLATHGAALVARLEDSSAAVRRVVVATLGKLEPATLAMHGAALVARLEDSDAGVREAVVETLGKLEPATIAMHGAALVARLEDSDAGVRRVVVATLGKLEPATIATHGAALVARLEDSDAGVRQALVPTLGKLEPATLATHGAALVAKLENSDAGVRRVVVATLGKLEPATLATHGAALVAKLEDSDAGVRRVVVATLRKLGPAMLTTHGAALVARLEEACLEEACLQPKRLLEQKPKRLGPAWFRDLFGFDESSTWRDNVNHFHMDGDTLVCRTAPQFPRQFVGRFECPSVAELRSKLAAAPGAAAPSAGLRFAHLAAPAGVEPLHFEPSNAGAVFQADSQFNCLIMTGPSVSPTAGVGIYFNDRTQGIACALACPAATVYRNYLVQHDGSTGQHLVQIDNLKALGVAVGNGDGRYWVMQNGYAMPVGRGSLAELAARLRTEPNLVEQAVAALRVGVHWETSVAPPLEHRVCQVYASALPCAYARGTPESDWEPFARLVLRAAYEATLAVGAVRSLEAGGARVKCYLTALGEGVFGNRYEWIRDAIFDALDLYQGWPLDVVLVHFDSSRVDANWAHDLPPR